MSSPDRPELVGAVIDAAEDVVQISFTDAEGTPWVIEYSVLSKLPQ